MINSNFWNNKKVLITGHTGFKGMWLSLILKSIDASIYGLSYGNHSDIYKRLGGEKYFDEEYFYDLSNYEESGLESVFSENKFDLIFHLAAQSLVPTAVKYPLETLNTNIFGTYQVLNFSNMFETTNSIVVSTTDKVYRDPSEYNNELSPLGGHEFYSTSKVAQEMVIEAFKNLTEKGDLNISTVRSGNVLGGGDGAKGRLLTDLVKALKNKEDIILRNPNSIRPWQDIMDSLYGYLLVAEENYSSKKGDIFNLNSEINNEITVKEIAQKMIDYWKSEIRIVESKGNDFYESSELRLDSSKAKNLLAWNDSVSIDQIIEKIVEWEKAEDEKSSELISFNQINNYFQE